MSEYIVRETDCGLATKQEIVGELVRCEDCKWYDMSKCMVTTEMGHHYVCRVHSYRPVPEDYCSQGERKDG